MKNNVAKLVGTLLILALPSLVFAADVTSIINLIRGWVSALLPILVGIAVLVFIWGMVTFIAKSGDETGREEGKQRMIWSVIAIFAIVSIWGIVGFIGQSLNIGQGGNGTLPGFPGATGGTGGSGSNPDGTSV